MDFNEYYSKQAENDFPIYRGVINQRGYGLGGVFRKIFRYIMPIIKTHSLPILKSVGKATLKGATEFANDALDGKDIKESAEKRLLETLNDLKLKTSFQKGSGIKRKLTRKIQKKKSKNKRISDIFDLKNEEID